MTVFNASNTRLLLLIVVLVLVAWDVLAIRYGGPQASISRVTFDLVSRYPMLSLAVGIVIGHIFWPE